MELFVSDVRIHTDKGVSVCRWLVWISSGMKGRELRGTAALTLQFGACMALLTTWRPLDQDSDSVVHRICTC